MGKRNPIQFFFCGRGGTSQRNPELSAKNPQKGTTFDFFEFNHS
jgi:hypothetical protein